MVDVIKALEGYNASQHMEYMLTPEGLKECVDRAVDFIKNYPEKFDSIAFSGMSGAILGPSIAMLTGKKMIMVRKEQDTDNHSWGRQVEGYRDTLKYIIVDDLVASGRTAARIQNQIAKFAPLAECLGVLSVVGHSGRGQELDGLTTVSLDGRITRPWQITD